MDTLNEYNESQIQDFIDQAWSENDREFAIQLTDYRNNRFRPPKTDKTIIPVRMSASANVKAAFASAKPTPAPPTETPIEPKPHAKVMAPPCPPVSSLKMVEATLWDNFGSKDRPERLDKRGRNRAPIHRYGLEFHGWTLDPANIKTLRQLSMPGSQHFSTSTRLYPVESMAAIIPKMVTRGLIDQAYADTLMRLVAQYEGSAVKIGLFSGNGASTKGVGKAYIPNQFVVIELFEGAEHAARPDFCQVHIDGEILTVTGWSDKLAGSDKPLRKITTATGETPLFAARNDLSGQYRWSGWDSRAV